MAVQLSRREHHCDTYGFKWPEEILEASTDTKCSSKNFVCVGCSSEHITVLVVLVAYLLLSHVHSTGQPFPGDAFSWLSANSQTFFFHSGLPEWAQRVPLLFCIQEGVWKSLTSKGIWWAENSFLGDMAVMVFILSIVILYLVYLQLLVALLVDWA